jgi:hypothetical protein
LPPQASISTGNCKLALSVEPAGPQVKEEFEEFGTLPIFLSDVEARRDKMVEFTRRVMSDKRGTMSAECDGLTSRLSSAYYHDA